MAEQKTSKPTKRLFEYADNSKYLTIASWVLATVSAFIALVPFYYIWRLIKEVIRVSPDFDRAQNLSAYGWCAVGSAVLAMLIYMGGLICSHLAAFHVQATMRSRLMRHIMSLPLGSMDEDGSGKVRKIINESSAATETYLAHQLPDKCVATATPIGLVVLLLVFDWRLGLLSLIPVVLGFAIMSTMMGANMKKKMEEYQNALEEMSSEAVEYVRGIPVVKTFGQSVFSFKRFRDSIKKYEKWTIAYTKDLRVPMMGLTTAINSVFAILIAATFWLGGVKSGSVDGTFLLNLMFYIIITPIITVTMTKMMYAGENVMIVEDALNRIDGLLEKKPLPQSVNPEKPQDASISFKNVSYRYDGASDDAIHNISLDIKSGEHIAFVGPSGGGKSTLAKLIARFADVNSGFIEIGGVNVKNIKASDLMNTVSFVFQDSKLLKMSIFDNVRMGNKNATREEVIEALHNAQCDDIIEKIPGGIDTVIGSKGTYLSGGETQRIAIARAMLKNAPILILDEATAFADPDNEAKVQAAFSKLSEGKTVIMIAHRLSSVTEVDRIYVLKNGQICQSGTHENLLSQDGLYAHMWKEFNKSVSWKVGA
ncbi:MULTISPECIES: ABC transporter ATP-binding protein [Blautia]|nr:MULTISPECIES: ABC transporter ATP-binding protein [Blautia]RHQ35417.1 ABC transporter ATP-binding protein [Ruminococcus sp. AF25-28AC]MCB5688567.1 ABC transporter ATP-binding protein/permease [Blautia wexlerae]NSD02099.1 ABC transporter ATP-binding protein [Blautia wexlerae]NSE93518.1 ABC transporter ATP-binding protein [Blautia wexlerae]NSF15064.1 ABC transporter ATP-binding protein [Blautia wexlerae]